MRTFANPGFGANGFGSSIAAVGANVLIGAPHAAFASYSGVAYLFDGATGSLLRTFTNPTPDPNDGFGQGVGIFGTDVLVDDPYDSTDLPSAGQVHRFDAGTGALLRTYHAPGGASGTFGYGAAVELAGGDLLAGAPGDRTQVGAFGAAYVLDAQTGALKARLLPPAGEPANLFGYAVATLGTYAVVQAPHADAPLADAGAVYLFEPCGSGVVTGDEECDDGNTADGDGCSSLCFVEPCTPVPPSCSAPAPASARLTLKEGGKDVLAWRWRGASALPDFGDPTTTSHYEFCIYDGSGGPQPRFARTVAAGETCDHKPCWQADAGGFQWRNPKPVPGGIAKILIKASGGTGKLSVMGAGQDLDPPALPLTPPVIVQFHNVENGVCWGGQYSNPLRNQPGEFSARSDSP